MDRLTRKDLKHDRFVEEVGHTVEFLGEHRKQAIRIGIAAAAVILLIVGIVSWRRYAHTNRQRELSAALEIQNSPIGQNPFSTRVFNTEQERRTAATKAFGDIAAKHDGTDEGYIAKYYLGVIATDQGKTAEAEKFLKDVAENAGKNYASLAALALADIYSVQGKTAEAEKLLRNLVANPTDFVSKEQAQIQLAQAIASTKPDEARKLLEPLRTQAGAVSRVAINTLGQINAAAKK